MVVRVDKWLWSVRVFKTRSQATRACAAGQVTVDGRSAKPAHGVGRGDVVSVRLRDRTVVHEVVEPIDKRVSAARAAECIVDRSPPSEVPTTRNDPTFGRRDPGAGRPTKRERRRIDRLRGRG